MAVRLNLPASAQITVKPHKSRHTVALWDVVCVGGEVQSVFKGSTPLAFLLNKTLTISHGLKCIQIAIVSDKEMVPYIACADGLSVCKKQESRNLSLQMDRYLNPPENEGTADTLLESHVPPAFHYKDQVQSHTERSFS